VTWPDLGALLLQRKAYFDEAARLYALGRIELGDRAWRVGRLLELAETDVRYGVRVAVIVLGESDEV
jgi:hypothetical protein